MSFTSRILVILQFISLMYFLLFSEIITPGSLALIQLIGFAISLWSVFVMRIGNFNVQPEVKQNAVFVEKGPYRLIRNPMYTGLIIFFGTTTLYFKNPLDFVFFIILVIALILKIQMEEKFLEERFGDQYLAYKKRTKRLIPFLF